MKRLEYYIKVFCSTYCINVSWFNIQLTKTLFFIKTLVKLLQLESEGSLFKPH